MDEQQPEESPKIIPCKYCGQSIPETTNFCWYCGRELIARPERPEYHPPSRVSGKMLLIIMFLLALGVGAVLWSLSMR